MGTLLTAAAAAAAVAAAAVFCSLIVDMLNVNNCTRRCQTENDSAMTLSKKEGESHRP